MALTVPNTFVAGTTAVASEVNDNFVAVKTFVDGLETDVTALETDVAALEIKSPVITLAGDLTGSATLTNLGNATLTATVAPNSVALGTDTTGNYVSNVTAGTGVTVTHTPGEGSSAAVAIDSSVVTVSGTQTLTNKTLTSPTITGVSPVVTLSGDVTGSATLTNLGSATITATIAANSVALGTDTTGNYVSNVAGGTGITVTHTPGEGSTPTVAIDGTVATLSGSQTLTNKTITTPLGIVKGDVGLGNVDNTSDANKPVSTATQTELNLKSNLASPTFTGTVVLPSTTSIGTVSSTEIGYVDGVTSAIQTQLNAKAPLASPTFTGVPTAPTATIGTNTTQVATTEFVLANTGTIPSDTITSAMIVDGTIVNADINASAGIALSKLATSTAGNIIVYNSSGVPTAVSETGDVTISATGVTAITSGVIVNSDINASAAIAPSKISGTAIVQTIVDAKGDLIVASANDTVGRLAVGATNGHVLTVDSTESLGVKWAAVAGGSGMTELDAQTFTSSTTYTVVPGAKVIVVEAICAGGGGGGGGRNTGTSQAAGGGGGAGGAHIRTILSATEVGATATVTIGSGGTGGAGRTATTGNGNYGVIGGNSRFGPIYFGGSSQGVGGSTFGGVGTNSGYTHPLVPTMIVAASTYRGFGSGGPGSTGSTGSAGSYGFMGGGAGGGGGGINTATRYGGGYGGGSSNNPTTATSGFNYAAVGGGGAPGSSFGSADGLSGTSLAGGGGGGSNNTGAGGNGGNGATPGGGGGGGGGANNDNDGGNGGAGGNAQIKIWVFG
jgi:hypothetical protein